MTAADPAPVADVLAAHFPGYDPRSHTATCLCGWRSAQSFLADPDGRIRAHATHVADVLADREPVQTRAALSIQVERGVECFHGVERGCTSYRCGSNCSQRFDRMHPCPACLIAEIHDLRESLQTDTAKVLAEVEVRVQGLGFTYFGNKDAAAVLESVVRIIHETAKRCERCDNYGVVDGLDPCPRCTAQPAEAETEES